MLDPRQPLPVQLVLHRDGPVRRRGFLVRCECGRQKDRRSKRCAVCARASSSIDGAKHWVEAEVSEALQRCDSLSEAARQCGVSRHLVTRFAASQGIDLSHMRTARGRVRSDEATYTIKTKRDSGAVRKHLRINEPEIYICATCGLKPEWNGADLVLQLDHINGDCCDDRRSNLRWLCPNCHSQTDTYTGRNRRREVALT